MNLRRKFAHVYHEPELDPSPAECSGRLPHHVQVNEPAGRGTVVTVEVIPHIRITRCLGPI